MSRSWVVLLLALGAGCSSSGGGGGGVIDGGSGSGGSGGTGGGATGGSSGTGGSSSSTLSCEPMDGLPGCICVDDPNGNIGGEAVCDDTWLGGDALCCADSTYPGSGTCSCTKWTCATLSGLGSCMCGPDPTGDPALTCASYPTCCNVESQGAIIGCVCDQSGSSSTCDGIGTPVASCSPTQGTCGDNRVQVTSCSDPGAL
jgi:hypothetical protein